MKALAIDGAISRLTIAAKNDDKICTTVFDIGMRQSEILVPSIESVLEKVNLSSSELDYITITIGPGSFTGLRLAISAAKAIELAYNIPIYPVSSLKIYSYDFENFEYPVLSCIDAKKERFYANLFNKDKYILEDGDYEISKLIDSVKKIKKLIICGPDCELLKNIIQEKNKKISIFTPKIQINTCDSLFKISEKNIADKIPPLKDFDGPVYLRASEAEIKLEK